MMSFMAHRDISLRCGIWSLSGRSGHPASPFGNQPARAGRRALERLPGHDPGEGVVSARGCLTKSSVALPWEPKQGKPLPPATSALRRTFCRQILGDLHAQILLQRSA
jgi:hypothetical protein